MRMLPTTTPDLLQRSPESRHRKTVLPNGIRVVTEEIPYVRSIAVGAWVDVGSRDERPEKNGISHFLEHMAFKGTRRYTTQQIARSLESVGGYINAFTTKEQTCFYARILDDFLPKAIDVISELVQHPVFKPKDLEREKGVVLEELKNLEDDPEDLIHECFDRKVFSRHPLGFPIIGRAETIRSFTRNDLIGYVDRHYVPHRMVIAAAGRLQHEQFVSMVDRLFGAGRARGNRTLVAREPAPRQTRLDREVIERPITQSHVCLGTIGFSVKNRLRYALLVLNSILGEGMSSRLFQNIRERYGFAYSVYSFANLMSDSGSFGVYIGTDRNHIDQSIGLIHRELEKLTRKPIAAAELRRTKAQLKGSTMLSLESMSNRMMRLGTAELYFGQFVPLDSILRSIDAVTVEDVSDVANRLFQLNRFSTVIIKPTVGPTDISRSVAA